MTQRVYPVSGLFENISELQPNNIVYVDVDGVVTELAIGNSLQINGGQLDVVLDNDLYVAMEGTNIGTGIGVFAVRDGNTLKFKSIQGGSSKVVVTNDAENLYVHVVGVADYTHTHLISDVTGLQTVLDNKTNIGHTHVVADITNFNSSVNSIIGASSINALSDVFIDTPIINQFLVYDGSQWTNSTISYTFLSLQDTPITYVGQANKLVRVNVAQTGLEFTDSIDIQSINAQTISIQGNDVASSLDNKVDKIVGKGLSTNDYTNYDKGVVDVTDTINYHSGYSTVLTGGEMTLTGGVNFSISAGTGLVRDVLGNLVEISWPTLTGSVPQDGDNFVYIDNTGSIIFSTIKENYDDIFIGYIVTDITNTSVLGFNTIKLPYHRFLFHIGQFTENVINVMVEHGVEFTIQSPPNTLNINVSAGTIWSVFNKVTFPQRTTFRKFYKDVNSNYLEETSTTPNAIDNINWNDTSQLGAAAIKPMTAGYYKKDSFFISTRGNVFYEYGMAEYEHYDDALIAPPPVINPISTNVAVIAHVIVQQGNPVPIAVIDVRPMFSKLWNGEQFREFIETASHHQLNGLEHDDHLQYHTDVRGDARYYRKTELDSGVLDARYYTESEITTLLSGKANSVHTHVAADITDLSKSSVGLSNVQNVDQTNASNITSGTLANARLTTNLSQIGGLVQSNGDIIAVVGGVYAARTIAQYKTDLSLNNVANVDTTNASNISSGTLANARLTTNLSQLGSITFNANDVMQFNGTTLTNVSMASLKTSLSLTKSDVGLGNVANVDTTNASNISSGTLANARLTANLSQIGSITFNANDYLQFNGLAIVNVTPSAVKTSLSLVKGDVGLGNVANVDTTNASNISSGTLANARLTANLSQIGGLTLSTNDFIQYNGTTLTNVTPSAVKTSLSLVKGDVGLGNVSNNLQVINAGGAVSYALGTNASKPVAGTAGRQYYSTDQGITYYDNGTTWAAELPAYTGDVTSSLGGTALTLATVNSNVGTFNNLTVNGKGLVTSASNVSYLTGNQTITLSGDITGSGTTGITGTLATVNSNTGSFGSTSVVPIITVNGKGLITAVSTGTITPTSIGLGNVTNSLQVINAGTAVSLASGTNASKPAAGTAGRFYDSTDQGLIYFDNGTTWTAQVPAYTGDVTSTLGGSTLTLATVNSNIGTFNNVTVNAKGLVTAASNVSYLTGNQTITVTGDATGSGTTGIALTLASVNSNVGTFNNVTVNAKGLVTAASNVSYVADSGTNGIMVRTALNTTTSRSITGTTNQITVTNGNGVAGDPTVLIADNPVLPGTGSVTLPTGTSAQRDSAAVNGKLRWNTDLLQVEVSDTNVYRILGKVAQFITGNIAQTTGTTILPYDATLPQSTEGFQIWTANITPLYNNSTIVVIFNIFTEVSTAINTMSVALFNGTTAIATNSGYTGIANTATNLSIIKTFTSGTTSAITLSARSGPSVASTMYVNRGNTETLSGAPNTSYIIMEIV